MIISQNTLEGNKMLSRLPHKVFEPSLTLDCFTTRHYFKFRFLETRSTKPRKFKFRLFAESKDDKWKLHDMDTNSTQEKLKSWLSKTQNFLTEVTLPLAKSNLSGKPVSRKELEVQAMQQVFMAEQTIDSTTPNGNLSLAAILSIEQFSRMNGLTGFKMQKIFKALVEESVYNDRRNLVEYCCFRFLSRDSSTVHPCLKEPAFQQLIFITMLAWENPYGEENDPGNANLQGKLVCEEAFLRIAPAIPGVADHSTAHNLFKALCGDEQGISLQSWLTYVDELLKVHEGRKSYQNTQHPQLSKEQILCLGSSRKQPVLKWESNLAWPGKVILTEKALYFEAVGLVGKKKDMIRFDLTRSESQVHKTKVGPFGSGFLDSAVSVSHGPRSDTWVLEFVDLGGESRRDVWHAFISEVIALHKFVCDFGPEDSDQSVSNIYGAQKGYERATTSAVNSISRLQALQFAHKVLEDPIKLVQFSYLQNAPQGDLVRQTLALNFWGGPLVESFTEAECQPKDVEKTYDAAVAARSNVLNIDGSVYPRKWMRSPSWATNASLNFWKNCSIKQGVVLSKNLVVGGATLVEKAATKCKEKSQVAEKTQATIDAATLKGIPSNIDLFKELMLPLTLVAMRFEKLRRWEKPHLTISFLVFANAIIFRNLLSYVLPAMLMVLATCMLALKGLKQQGRLGRLFGKVTIRDQPPSNTIQKIIAVKDAMQDVEYRIQNLNVTLLKIRTIFLAGQPEVTTEVAVAIFVFGVILLLVPFKYVASFLLFDFFTRELEFRREMVKKFITFLTERWEQVPAAPVVVLPFETGESKAAKENRDVDG